MSDKLNIVRLILFTCIMVIIKVLSELFMINQMLIFRLLELFYFFCISFSFSFLTDYCRVNWLEKLKINLVLAAFFSLTAFLISIFKILFFNTILIAGLNYLIFFILSALPLLRDHFFYHIDEAKIYRLNCFYIAYFLFMKLVFNLIHLIGIETPLLNQEIFMLSLFVIIMFISRALILSLFIKGYLEYDGKEYIIFERFRVGKSRSSQIVIEDDKAPRSVFFNITAQKDKFFIKPGFELKLENKTITGKTQVADGDTIKCCGDYFTVITRKGSLLKRLILIFFMLLVTISVTYGRNYFLLNLDYSLYPDVNAYIYLNEEIFDFIEPQDIAIIEADSSTEILSIDKKNFDLDIVLLLDVTGNMVERYQYLARQLKFFCQNLKKDGKRVRLGLVTFADKAEDIRLYPLTKNIDQIVSHFNEIKTIDGKDYKENPYEALLKLKEFQFKKTSQKVVVLFTDAPPHTKGDINQEGVKDYSFKTTEYIQEYLKQSNYLLFIASYERFPQYQSLIRNSRFFFDIEIVENLGSILDSLEHQLNNQIKARYYSQLSYQEINQFGLNSVKVIIGEQAMEKKRVDRIKKIQQTSFLKSLFEIF